MTYYKALARAVTAANDTVASVVREAMQQSIVIWQKVQRI